MMAITTKSWVQVMIPSVGRSLTGSEFAAKLVSPIEAAATPWVAFTDMDVSGEVRAKLLVEATKMQVRQSNDFLELLSRANAVDWATLFFCGSREQAYEIRGEEPYSLSLEKSTFAARVVDSEFFHFYCPVEMTSVVRALSRNSIIERTGPATELEFPE